MREDRTLKTQLGYLGKVIMFVEDLIPAKEKKDCWDLLRWPELHEAFLRKLLESSLGPSGRDNYRNVMNTVCNWSSGRGEAKDTGRWRTELDFPSARDEVFYRTQLRVATIWSDFCKHTTNPALVEPEEANEVLIDVTQ